MSTVVEETRVALQEMVQKTRWGVIIKKRGGVKHSCPDAVTVLEK